MTVTTTTIINYYGHDENDGLSTNLFTNIIYNAIDFAIIQTSKL